MLLEKPHQKISCWMESSLWKGHLSYACIKPQVHLPYTGKIDLSRVKCCLAAAGNQAMSTFRPKKDSYFAFWPIAIATFSCLILEPCLALTLSGAD